MFKVGTVFSGIGAPEVAIKELGADHTIEFACDCDKSAKKTYMANHRCKDFYDDVESVDCSRYQDLDLFVFGFPCKSFSIAGKRKGFQDIRGQLFFKAVSIIKKIKPKTFIAENVAGIVSLDGGKVFKKVIKTLRGLGYKIYYEILNSLDYGVPHQRKRVYIVGIRKDLDRGDFIFQKPSHSCISLSSILDKKVPERFDVTKEFLGKQKVQKRLSMPDKKYMNCLTETIARAGSSSEFISYVSAVYHTIGIYRRPTPRECARLHGFPESFVLPEAVSVTQRYRQFANTMTIPVLKTLILELVSKYFYEG